MKGISPGRGKILGKKSRDSVNTQTQTHAQIHTYTQIPAYVQLPALFQPRVLLQPSALPNHDSHRSSSPSQGTNHHPQARWHFRRQ